MGVEKKLKIFWGLVVLAIVLGWFVGLVRYISKPSVLATLIGLFIIGFQWAILPPEEESEDTEEEGVSPASSEDNDTKKQSVNKSLIRHCRIVNLEGEDYLLDRYGVLYSMDGRSLIGTMQQLEGRYIIPEGVEELLPYALRCQEHLTELIFPETMHSVGEYAMLMCRELRRVEFVSGKLCTIRKGAFAQCVNLRKIILPELSALAPSLFKDCWYLERLPLPSELRFVGAGVFIGCEWLKELVNTSPFISVDEACILDEVQSTLYCVWNRHILQYRIPESVKYIQSEAFKDCSALSKLYIPEGVERLGEACFVGCRDLEEVYLLSKLEGFAYEELFAGCSILNHIYVFKEHYEFYWDNFPEGSKHRLTLY